MASCAHQLFKEAEQKGVREIAFIICSWHPKPIKKLTGLLVLIKQGCHVIDDFEHIIINGEVKDWEYLEKVC